MANYDRVLVKERAGHKFECIKEAGGVYIRREAWGGAVGQPVELAFGGSDALWLMNNLAEWVKLYAPDKLDEARALLADSPADVAAAAALKKASPSSEARPTPTP